MMNHILVKKTVTFPKRRWKEKYANDENIIKLETIAGECTLTTYSIFNLEYSTLRESNIFLDNESNYDHHIIIKKLTEESGGQLTCLGENTKKDKTFSVPINKEILKKNK